MALSITPTQGNEINLGAELDYEGARPNFIAENGKRYAITLFRKFNREAKRKEIFLEMEVLEAKLHAIRSIFKKKSIQASNLKISFITPYDRKVTRTSFNGECEVRVTTWQSGEKNKEVGLQLPLNSEELQMFNDLFQNAVPHRVPMGIRNVTGHDCAFNAAMQIVINDPSLLDRLKKACQTKSENANVQLWLQALEFYQSGETLSKIDFATPLRAILNLSPGDMDSQEVFLKFLDFCQIEPSLLNEGNGLLYLIGDACYRQEESKINLLPEKMEIKGVTYAWKSILLFDENGLHYTALIKSREQWYLANDALVKQVRPREVAGLAQKGVFYYYSKT